jgi:hypothetical protein
MTLSWKEDWATARARLTAWWERKGLALCVTAPRDKPWEDIPQPHKPASVMQQWIDPIYRARQAEYELAHTYFGGEAFPYFDTQIGPGNLATFLGSEPSFAPDTVWYNACMSDPDRHPPLQFSPTNAWFQQQMAMIDEGLRISEGRFLVGVPDLIENIDILASLRGTQTLLMDMKERPSFVKKRLLEINRAFFDAFDSIYERVQTPWGGNAFSAFNIWGPGKTVKVQCDASAMFSPKMFAEFVVPALAEQCRWLDYSLYHLDGTQCIVHLDHLLAIEALDAIEWTPQVSLPPGGNPLWYDLYRRILKAGKGVQAIGVKPEEVVPLLDAVGPNGLFITTSARSEAEARRLVEKVERYRN